MATDASQPLRAGIDIGGTFTDLMLVDDATGETWVGKTLTTPEDPSLGVGHGLDEALAAAGLAGGRLGTVVHGTTLVTNAILERKGDRTALVTTSGFRDAVEIAREHRFDMYDIFLDLPLPIAPRRLRFELGERMRADGAVHRPVDPAEVDALARRLQAAGVEAVAICFLHAYRNPAHEREVAERLRELLPGVRLALSSEVVGEIREYERTSTTLANVYVQSLVERYLDRLQERLAELGSRARLLVMLSSGGLCTIETARRFPVRLIESGPAAGALAAAHLGRLAGRPDLLSFDMGGTTAKACLIEAGRPLVTTDFEVDRVYRFKKGSGLPIKASSIEMIEIGAGGGSIARIDRFGLVKVGPDSAGARPGPACYGLGGTRPTVTDADLVLGYLDPDFFLGGQMSLDAARAEHAIEEHVARPLGLNVVQAAWAIHQLVNENMAGAARMHAVERGKDVRSFPLFAFGGAGPLHAFGVAELLQVPEVLCPAAAGVCSSMGFLVAPIAFDFVRSARTLVASLEWQEVGALFEEMEAQGRALLAEAGVSDQDVAVERSADMQLLGQAHQISVLFPNWPLGPQSRTDIARWFEETYVRLYKRTCPGVPIEAMSWRLQVAGPRPELRFQGAGDGNGAETALKGERRIWLKHLGGFIPVPVYDRYRLRPGDRFTGPAIVEERESTVLAGPGTTAELDPNLNLVLRLGN